MAFIAGKGAGGSTTTASFASAGSLSLAAGGTEGFNVGVSLEAGTARCVSLADDSAAEPESATARDGGKGAGGDGRVPPTGADGSTMGTLIIDVTGDGAISVPAVSIVGSEASAATRAAGADVSTTGAGRGLGTAGTVNSGCGAGGDGALVGSGRVTSTTGTADEGRLT